MKSETKFSHRILAMILCTIMLFFTCDNALITLAQAVDSSAEDAQQEESREDIKTRLLDQIIYDGWDPYSADMTVDEFFALMELFDDGTLPLNQVSSYALIVGAEEKEASRIPRTKFMFAGLDDYTRIDGSSDAKAPLEYDNKKDYEDDGLGGYYYPNGLDPYDAGYMRPPEEWNGIATDDSTNRAVLVSKDVNSDNTAVAGDVIQDLFAEYTGYYVKQVTIEGANINVLGMIEVDGRYIYYYLSAEDQSTQVSTTTLPEEAKFIIEYVPIEHTVSYKVLLDGDVTDVMTPDDVVFYGKNAHQDVNWADGIFGENRPNVTTDGAYSFDVTVPYGYELEIYISIEMSPDISYQSIAPQADSFPVTIKHTGTKQEAHDAWLDAYSKYLNEQGFIDGDIRSYITETGTLDSSIAIEWTNEDDPDKPAHDSILERMAERINDFIVHNNGYALGQYPQYTEKNPKDGFKLNPNNNGPAEHTMLETFYNHLVKADRTITAVLTKQTAPTFDVSEILKQSSGADGRGSSATEDFAFGDYDADYLYHLENGTGYNGSDDPIRHSAVYPNVETADGWGWQNNKDNPKNNPFRYEAQKMRKADDGTYYYSWVFQTNSGPDNLYLDVLEVNGISVTIPYYPKYNWQGKYGINGSPEISDDTHPYFSEIKLADGATLRLEFLLGWNNSGTQMQRHYRVSVTGARSNVVITGLNIMQYGTGADEFATYNLVGVYSDMDDHGQTEPAIEYYSDNGEWERKTQSNVVVQQGGLGINYTNGDNDHYGANIRFKITEGYGSPYYSWTNRHGDVIEGQASDNNPVISFEDIENSEQGNGVLIGGKLDSQYIYVGGDGYYYIRVTTQSPYKIALLNIVARSVRFTVRYVPENDHEDGEEAWGGFLLHNVNDKDSNNDTLSHIDAEEVKIDLESMPRFDHNPDICRLWEMAKDNDTGDVPEKYQQILHQYDDNGVDFYDMIAHPIATIATNTYGTVRPKSNDKNYVFVDWVVVNEEYEPVQDKTGKYIRFLGGAIDFTKYAGYAVKHVSFGDAETDIHVLRLMPVWQKIEKPYTYKIVINRVDKDGNIYADNFSEYWDDVVTAMPDDENIYVYLNKDAAQFKSWIANHPTYKFWDDVNNIADNIYQRERSGGIARAAAADPETEALKQAIYDYLGKDDDNLLNGLKNEEYYDHESNLQPANDTFKRYGNDIFVANDDDDDERGTITLWMYETKGGVIFHKDVLSEPHLPDDEFYFSVNVLDDGEYTAYPEFVYDDEGNERERLYTDAMSVVFENGVLKSIDGVDTDHFSLKSGEGIALYGPAGTYTVAETGSKYGSLYKVDVKYLDETGKDKDTGENVTLPDSKRISGKNTKLSSDSVKAVAVIRIGESNVVRTLTFINQTHSLAIRNELIASEDDELWQHAFTYKTEFTLPEGEKPLRDDNGFYYSMTVYVKSDDGYVVKGTRRLYMQAADSDNIWQSKYSFGLMPDEYAVIVLPVPEVTGQTIKYKAVETEPTDTEMWYLQGNEYERTGSLVPGERTEEIYVNLPMPASIRVSKTVVRSDGVNDETSFNFTVTLTGVYHGTDDQDHNASDINGEYGDAVFTNGTATFSLQNGQSVLISPLPAGLSYVVTEEENSDYTTTSTNETGELVSGKTAVVKFVNTYKTQNGYLVITEKNGSPNESFLYRITDRNGNELIVSVNGGGQTVVCVPFESYTIEEISDWSWRYEDGVCDQSTDDPKGKTATVEITSTNDTPENAVQADYGHVRNDKVWLGGENNRNNHFEAPSASEEEQENDTPKQDIALPAVFDDKREKHSDNINA